VLVAADDEEPVLTVVLVLHQRMASSIPCFRTDSVTSTTSRVG
jgi:hypothetical protein